MLIRKNRSFIIAQDGEGYDLFNLPKGFVIKGSLDLSSTDLEKLPDLSEVEVEGNFWCSNNPYLKDLEGAPKVVGGDFACWRNNLLIGLNCSSSHVMGSFVCISNRNLKLLKGLPQLIEGNLNISDNPRLRNLVDINGYIGGCIIADNLPISEQTLNMIHQMNRLKKNSETMNIPEGHIKIQEKTIYCDKNKREYWKMVGAILNKDYIRD